MKLKKRFVMLTIGMLLTLGAEVPQLTWEHGEFAQPSVVEGNKTLIFQVPENVKQQMNCATAKMQLVPFRGATLLFRIRARAKEVSIPAHSYNGVKFMLNYVDGDDIVHYYNVCGVSGTFEWTELSFSAPITMSAEEGIVYVGLQESSGEVEFDLHSLKIDLLFPPVNSDYQAVYSEKIRKTPPSRGVMSPANDFTEDDLRTLKEWNVNLVRAQLCRNWGRVGTERNLAEYDLWLNARLDHFEKMFQLGYEKYGIRFVIDLHTPPGGRLQNTDMAMFYEKVYADHFIDVWKNIATRFRGNPAIWGYDLVNEPMQSAQAPYDYWNLQRMAAEAIRTIDGDTPIIIESNLWANPATFNFLPPLEITNVIYQLHMYLPGNYTHQLVGNRFGEKGQAKKIAYPGMIGDRPFDKEMLRKAMAPAREFQLKHKARIFVGEFSAPVWAPGAERYLADCISLFEEYGWDWTYHAFRESKIWSLECEGEAPDALSPSLDNPRKKVLLEGFKKNN